MIDAGVFISIIGSQLRIARRETGPQFAADRRAKTADKEVIITAGIRRPDPNGAKLRFFELIIAFSFDYPLC